MPIAYLINSMFLKRGVGVNGIKFCTIAILAESSNTPVVDDWGF